MSQAERFEPRRFRSTVPYYARFRLPYPESLIHRVIAVTGLARGERVLDLGCGPGLLAISLAKAGLQVVAVDPEPAMLAAAADAAAEAGVCIKVQQGSSFDLPKDL